MRLRREAELQYTTSDPLLIRIQTHQRYSERQIDLDDVCASAFGLSRAESVLDVGCGSGLFLSHLRATQHTGILVGIDRSRAMLVEAQSRGDSIDLVVADVEQLPFDDGQFERVSARHMLYYVDDLPAALRELDRVMARDGLFLATTNAARSTPRIDDLYQDLLRAFGFPVRRHAAGEFQIENAAEALRAVWNTVDETILDNAFVFTEPEPIVRYVSTLLPSVEPADATIRAEMTDWLLQETSNRLRRLGGVWRDPKRVGMYRCQH